MKSVFILLAALFAIQVVSKAQTPEPTVIFQETFESPDALNQWQIAPNGGRVRVVEDARNAANHGLLMDDADNDALFKQNAVSKTISVKGFSDIRVTVDIFSFNDESNNNTNAFDGVVLRVGSAAQWYTIPSVIEQRFDIQLDYRLQQLLQTNDGMLTIELAQYDNFSAPDDGLFFDNVTVTGFKTRDIIIEAPLAIKEADPLTLKVLISPVPTEPVTLQLWENGSAHGTAIYPAGATFVDLTFPNFQNQQLDGDRWTSMYLTDGHFYSQWISVRIQDDEFSGLAIDAPATLLEGTSTNVALTITAPHQNYLYVYLKSSDPSILSVPEYVTVGFDNRASFAISANENRHILPDREVTISATLGSERVDWKVKVTERNSLVPKISGAQGIVEGAQDQPYILWIDGLSDEPLTVTLNATPSTVSITPAVVTLQPGETQASFKMSVADDAQPQGDRPFSITAQINPSLRGIFSGKILDNEIAGFSVDLPDRMQADKFYSPMVHAVNFNGSEVTAFNGTANVYLKAKDSGTEQLIGADLQFTQGRASFAMNLGYSASGSSLVVRSSTGVSSISAPLVIFAKLAFAANDILWDSKRKALYVTSGAIGLPGYLQSVTPIDPAKGEIGQPLFLAGDARKLVITDNAKYLYVSLSNKLAVQRIDLDTFTAGSTIPLSAEGYGNVFQAYDLLPVPGRPLDIIVSQIHPNFGIHTTRLYVNGVVQPSTYTEGWDLAPAASTNEFFAYNSPSSSGQIQRYSIGPTSYTNTGSLYLGSSVFLPMYSPLITHDNLIFSPFGKIVDGKKMEVVGEFKLPAAWTQGFQRIAVAADAPRSRAFYGLGNAIETFETGAFQLVNESSIPGIGNILKIVRWGETGLALLTDNAEIVIFEDDRIVPKGPATDLALSLNAAPQPIFVSDDLTYTATVENRGANDALKVELLFDLYSGQSIKKIESGDFAQSFRGSSVAVSIGTMAPGAKHEVRVTTTVTNVTALVVSAVALTTSLDANYSNNVATTALNVGFKSAPNTVNLVKMKVNDVLVQGTSNRLVVAVGASAPSGIANHLMIMDPMSGVVSKSIGLPGEPGRLAVSDDGSTVYVINSPRTRVYRVNLVTGEVRTVSLSDLSSDSVNLSDLKVLRGTTDSVVIAASWYGVRIYDNGLVRGPGTGSYTGSWLALLADPQLGLGVDGSSIYKYEISGAGIRILSQPSSQLYGPIKSDDIYVYSEQGKVMRADLMSIAGTFDLSTAFEQNFYQYSPMQPERALRRAYFAREFQIASFDSDSYLHVRTISLDLPGKIASLERWGKDGFASRLDNGDLAIIRTDLIPDISSSIDLIVSLPEHIQVTSPEIIISGRAYHGQGIASVKVGEKAALTSSGYDYWFSQVDSLAPGDNFITITATALGATAETRTISRRITYTPVTGSGIAESWLINYFGSTNAPQSSATEDPDGDGQSNLSEFLFGTNPLVVDKPQFDLTQEIDGSFSVWFTHRDTPDFDFAIESSSNFNGWQSVATQNTVVPGGTFLISKAALPASQSQGQFFRLKAVKK